MGKKSKKNPQKAPPNWYFFAGIHPRTPQCHCYDFLVCLWNGLNFFELFKLLFSLGIDHDPHVFYVHMTYVYSFLHVLSFTRSHGQEKSLSYYDLFDFGVLLYGCTLTLILFYFFHNPTTPQLPIYVDQRRTHLQQDTSQSGRMIERKIP